MGDQRDPQGAGEDAARARRLAILRAMAASVESPPTPAALDRQTAGPEAGGQAASAEYATAPSALASGALDVRTRRQPRRAPPATPRQRAGTALIGAGVTLLTLVAVTVGAQVFNRQAPRKATAPVAVSVLSPRLADATVYFASNNGDASHFYALDALTGKQVWRILFGSSYTTPIVSGATVYTASSDGNVYALNARTGKPLWVTGRPDRGDAYLTLSGTALYAVDSFGIAYAFDAATGKIMWQVNGVPDSGVYDVFYSAPAVADGLVIAGLGRYPVGDGAIIAFDAATGAIRWRVSSAFAANAEPVVASGVVYVATTDGTIMALNVATGATVWSATLGSSFNSGVTLSGNTLYAFDQRATMYAINAATGAVIWQAAGRDTQGGYSNASPMVSDGVVYFCSQSGTLFAVTASNGDVLWKSTVGAAIVSTPAILDGALFFGDAEGNLYAMRAKDGVQAWVASLDTSSNASPAVAP